MAFVTSSTSREAQRGQQDGGSSSARTKLQTAIVSVEHAQAEVQVPSTPTSPPDGGLRAWSQVFAGHLINCLTWGFCSFIRRIPTTIHRNPLPTSFADFFGGICQDFLYFCHKRLLWPTLVTLVMQSLLVPHCVCWELS